MLPPMLLPPIATLSSPWTNQGAAFAHNDETPALIDLSNGTPRHFTYHQLQQGCDAAARALLATNPQPGASIAIAAANSAESLFAIFGAMRAGLVAVPVNWKLPAATVAHIIQDCGAPLVLHDPQRQTLCPTGTAQIDITTNWLNPGPHTSTTPNPHDPALFLYTSGSTGRPKGVVLSHHSHLWVMDVRKRATREPSPSGRGQGEGTVANTRTPTQTPTQNRSLVAAPLYHMNALAMVQSTWATGGAVILLPAFTPATYIQAAATHHATTLTAVPTMIAMMLREHETLAAHDLSHVTTIRLGSAPLTASLAADIAHLFPHARLLNGYGTTEAGPVVFEPNPAAPPTSVGAAHPEAQLRLMHENEPMTGAGEGTLEMRCPALMLGYHNLPEATAKAMTPDGFYRTNDVFHRDRNGFFTFIGRADDMFNSAGENIYPSEVEAVLARHPDVQQVAVIPIPDALKGHKPVAFVVPRPGTHPTEQALKQFVLDNAPPYHHPRRVWFVDALPLAGTNKIDRRALIERATAEATS